MSAAVDKEGRQVVAEHRGGLVDGELGEREVTVPVTLAAVGVGISFSGVDATKNELADSQSSALWLINALNSLNNNRGAIKALGQRRIGGQLLNSYGDTAASVQPIMDRAQENGRTIASHG